jgi:hypothetical protein
LLLLGLPLMAAAQQADPISPPDTEKYLDSIRKQFDDAKASDFSNKSFSTNSFKTRILNEKDSNLMRSANNFSFPNNSFARQFETNSYQGFSNRFTAPDNRSFATNKTFDPGGRPFEGKTLDYQTNRDSGRSFTAQDWDRKNYFSDQRYQGKEVTEVGSFSGTVVLQNKDDVKWEQDSLTSGQIKEILNKNK